MIFVPEALAASCLHPRARGDIGSVFMLFIILLVQDFNFIFHPLLLTSPFFFIVKCLNVPFIFIANSN